MELIAMAILSIIVLIIFTIVLTYRGVYIKKNTKMTNRDFFIQFFYLVIMILLMAIVPFYNYTADVDENSTMITTQEIVVRQFVVDGVDTLLLSSNSTIDTLSVEILPDSIQLKTETTTDIFGSRLHKKILE